MFSLVILCYNIFKGNRYRMVRLPHREKFYLITLRARQGDYFFLLLLSLVRLTIKEINDIITIPNAIIKDIA